MRKQILKKCLLSILILIILTGLALKTKEVSAEASTTRITVENFAKYLARELKLLPIEGPTSSGYVNILLSEGIIKKGDFTSYKGNITRGDVLVLLNRADEWLYGDTIDSKLVDTVIEKRISDISKIKENKRVDFAKGYIKGFLMGYSNGKYATDRELRVSKKITKDGAVNCISMLRNKSKRAQISPDGQLIRTTKLPVYADKYPYILASYPNEYYDWKFYYEDFTRTRNGKEVPYVNIEDYAAPIDVDKTKVFGNFESVKEENLDTWVSKVKTYLECVFNVDYRTIDDDWMEKVLSTDYTYGYSSEDQTRDELNKYVSDMKANKTIVESSKIAVDGSSLYFFNGCYYLRTYVRYRIVSSKIKYGVDVDELISDRPYNNILWTYELVDLSDYKINGWKESYFDVCISYYDGREKNNLGVAGAILDEYYYIERRVK